MAGNLDEIRDAARAQVHAQFALPAIIREADGSAIGEAQVRLHRSDSRAFGDLDREGFAFTVEGKVVLVFDTAEFMPKRNQRVDFGRGRVFDIETVTWDQGERYKRCTATEVVS